MIRWEQDPEENYWCGYIGKIHAFNIHKSIVSIELIFHFENECADYTRLDSAKKGAERMLNKWLESAGLKQYNY